MPVFKCKMCGGDLTPIDDNNTCECEFCGTLQTIPSADNEKKVNLFNRANRLRMANDFDKSASVYENIVAEFPEEAEAYWGLCLCKYGIEYVDDPATGKKIPTCHRASFDNIMEDSNFDMALEYADTLARNLYREEAKYIDKIQKSILEIARKEEPFDVFICYKETDDNGERTKDSVLAQDIYSALIKEGYKVFFSRITLEDKLGQEYEPYIFSALNTAKVMLAIGTSYDYYQSPWVKNEWSRYQALMKKDSSKTLIPCYADIDAYDMPNEFRNLQGQDMRKLGFLQDLIRGINKLLHHDEPAQATKQTVVTQSGTNVTALLKRGAMALEDAQWDNAKNFFDEVLNSDAECAEAYLGLVMAELNCKSKKELAKKIENNGINNRNFDRAKQFADSSLKADLENWEKARKDLLQRQEEERQAEEARKKNSIAEKREKLQKLKNDLVSCDQMDYSASQKAKMDEARSEIERIKQNYDPQIKEADSQIRKTEEQIENTKKQITDKEQYLAKLGIFKGKEKAATKEDIENLKNTLSSLESQKAQQQEQKNKLESVKSSELGNKEDIFKSVETELKNEIAKKKKEIGNRISTVYIEIAPLMGIKGINGNVGDTVEYGNSLSDNKRIEWQILDVQGSRKVLIAKHFVDLRPYNTESKAVTWETCTLRKWLNNEFYNNAFSDFEKGMITETLVKADPNPEEKTSPGRDTKDKVFLLSIKEAEQYFKTDADRKCDGKFYWWLRSPGRYAHNAANVKSDGSIFAFGGLVSNDYYAVRPALWINLES